MRPVPTNSILEDDLLLDRLGARLAGSPGAGGDPLVDLLSSYAAAVDVPITRRRRWRSHRALGALGALVLAGSGAGLAAAVAPPSNGTPSASPVARHQVDRSGANQGGAFGLGSALAELAEGSVGSRWQGSALFAPSSLVPALPTATTIPVLPATANGSGTQPGSMDPFAGALDGDQSGQGSDPWGGQAGSGNSGEPAGPGSHGSDGDGPGTGSETGQGGNGGQGGNAGQGNGLPTGPGVGSGPNEKPNQPGDGSNGNHGTGNNGATNNGKSDHGNNGNAGTNNGGTNGSNSGNGNVNPGSGSGGGNNGTKGQNGNQDTGGTSSGGNTTAPDANTNGNSTTKSTTKKAKSTTGTTGAGSSTGADGSIPAAADGE